MARRRFILAVTLSFLVNKWQRFFVSGSVIISEIAGKGSSNACSGNDWLELHNTDSSASVDLSGYTLHDDKGIGDDKAFTFPQDYKTLLPGEYRVICTQQEDDDKSHPQFSIGGDDTVTLVSNDRNTVVFSVGPLPDTHNDFDITYAWDSDGAYAVSSIERPSEIQQTGQTFNGKTYFYTSTPTPGMPNVLTQVGETAEEIKARLAQQNEQGTRFFGMDSQGFPVDDALDPVLDLHMTMEENDYESMMENKGFEVYFPFQSARLTTARFPNAPRLQEEILSLSKPGRIRTKGQTTLYFGTCMGTTTVPFQLELNDLETMFGVGKMYLRNHFADPTFMRDWAMNKMLARFGLPHLRSRHIRFFINGHRIGLYTLTEAIDHEYVMARSFPDYNPFNYALYKWKADAIKCGNYDPDALADARDRLNDTSKPPYSFERGTHRDPIPVYGRAGFVRCLEEYWERLLMNDRRDLATLYLKHQENCGEMLVDGLKARELGTKNWDAPMKDHVNKYFMELVVDGNSDMDKEVDVDSYLKLASFYAVMLSQDSPLGNELNNFYMAQTGDGKGYKLFANDHNLATNPGTRCPCGDHSVHWSIARPTCGPIAFNPVFGPLLLKPEYHARYIEYVRDFVEQVVGADDLLDEIQHYAQAIERFVEDDFWNFGNYDAQFSTNPDDWNDFRQPLLPFLLARADSIRQQLAAIDAGTMPRGPHQAVKVEVYEECVDWRSTEAPEVACYNNCIYEGCYENGWRLSHHCIEETGTCLQGTYDPDCRGIPEGEQYPGMESPREYNGLDTFCFNSDSIFPVKTSVCPDPPRSNEKKRDSNSGRTATMEIKAVPDIFNGG